MATKKLQANGKALLNYGTRDSIRRAYKGALGHTYAGVGADLLISSGEVIYRTIKTGGYPRKKIETKYSDFRIFRDNLANSAKHKVGSGTALTQAQEHLEGSEELIIKYIKEGKLQVVNVNGKHRVKIDGSPEMTILKAMSGVDFSDPDSVDKAVKTLRRCGEKLHLTDSDDMTVKVIEKMKDDEGLAELAIAMNLNGSGNLKQYLKKAEGAINIGLEEEAQKLRDRIKDIDVQLKHGTYTGSSADLLKEKGECEAALLKYEDLRKNGTFDYIAGRIASGEIDVEKVINDDGFGVKTNDDINACLRGLSDLSNVKKLQNDHQNEIIKKLGGKESSIKRLNLNNIKHVRTRQQELGKALETAGYAFVSKGGVVKRYDQMSLKQLKKVDVSKMSPDAQEAFSNLVSLKQHEEVLKKVKAIKSVLKRGAYLVMMKTMSNDYTSSGTQSITTSYRYMRLGWKVVMKARKFVHKINKKIFKSVGKKFQKAADNGNKFAQNVVKVNDKIQSLLDTKKRALEAIDKAKTQAAEKFKEALNNIRGKAAKKRAAKRAERKVARQAGRHSAQSYAEIHTAGGAGGSAAASGAGGTAAAGGAGGTAAAAEGTAAAGGSTAAAGGTTAGTTAGTAAGGSAAAGAGAAWWVMIIIIIVILIIIILCLFSVIDARARMLMGDVEVVVAVDYSDGKWSTSDPIEDPVDYAVRVMQQMEQEADDIDLQVKKYLGNNRSFYSFADPKDSFKSTAVASYNVSIGPDEGWRNYFSKNDDMWTNHDLNYRHTNPYSTIKKALALAHVVTADEDPAVFIRYAVCSWAHMNQITLSASCSVCDGDGTYTYYCNNEDDPVYKISNIKVSAPGGEVSNDPIENTASKINGTTLVLVEGAGDSYIKSASSVGCRVKYYTAAGQECNADYDQDSGYASNATYTTSGTKVKLYDLFSETKQFKTSTSNQNPLRITTWQESVYTGGSYLSVKDLSTPLTYNLDPYINSNCSGEFQQIHSDAKAAINSMIDSGNLYFHEAGYGCDNMQYVYCSGCKNTTKYHDTSHGPCSCAGCITNITYTCLGHDTPVTVYDSYKYEDSMEGPTYSHAMDKPCDNCVSFTTIDGYVHYDCLGHAYKLYHSNPMTEPCDHCVIFTTSYTCPGYVEKSCPGHLECMGHIDGEKHYYCPGHTFTYCTGHMEYIVNHRIVDEEDLVESMTTEGGTTVNNVTEKIFDDWIFYAFPQNEYSDKKPIGLDWDNHETESSKEMQKRMGFPGWSDFYKEIFYDTVNNDWYASRGYASDMFRGGQISSLERKILLSEHCALLTELPQKTQNIINTAIESVGQIPCFPDEEASEYLLITENYEQYPLYSWFNRDAFIPVIKNNNMYSVTGLDPKYYIAWLEKTLDSSTDVSKYYPDNIQYKDVSGAEDISSGNYLVQIDDENNIVLTAVYIGQGNDGTYLVTGIGQDWCQKMTFTESEIFQWKLVTN